MRTQGIEFDGEIAIGGGLSASAAYTYLDAIDRVSRAELTGRHRHHGAARVTWAPTARPWRAELRGAFYGAWLASATERAPAFAVWDAIAAYTLRSGVELFTAVDNMLDSQDPNTGTSDAIFRPDIGRTWRVGARWTWRQR